MKKVFSSKFKMTVSLEVVALLTVLVFAMATLAQQLLEVLPPKPPAPPLEPLFPGRIDPEVLQVAADQEQLNLIVFLTKQPREGIAAQEQEIFVPQLLQLSEQIRQLTQPFNLNDIVPEPIRRQALALQEQQDDLLDQMRANIYARLKAEVGPQQDAFEQFVQRELGGTVENKVLTDNSLGVKIASKFLERLSQHPDGLHVALNHPMRPALDVSAPTMGANTWWNNSLDGDGVTDVAVIDTGVDTQHPGLSAHRHPPSEKDFVNAIQNPDDIDGHGTAIAGIIVSTNATYKGIAPGLDIIVNAKISSQGQGVSEQRIKDATEWAVLDTTNGKQTAEIVNLSFVVQQQTGDDPSVARYFDGVVNSYLATVTFAAGNSASTMEFAPRAYNGITVGNMNDGGNSNRSNDTLAPNSPQGPTPNGRNKPDLVAPGTLIKTTMRNWEVIDDYSDHINNDPNRPVTGSSFSAPHVAGAAGLLMNAEGLQDPRRLKALLINTAETKGTPDSVGWAPGYGYGYVDLTKAYNQRWGTIATTLTPSQSRWYRGTINPNDKVTIVWHRRVINPPNPTVYQLSDIDLYLYRTSDGNLLDYSNEVIENVEQVKYNGASAVQVDVRVHAYSSSFNGATSETVAVAFPSNTPFTEFFPAAPPQPIGTSASETKPLVNALGQNFPNTFNPETWMPYAIRQASEVTIQIYDTQGQLIRTLSLGKKAAGRYFTREKAAYWDGRNEHGERVTSGVYFYHIQAGEFAATRKMVMKK